MVRAILWLVIAGVFVAWNVRRIAAYRVAGFTVPWWNWVQLGLWSAALLFWLWTGWRDLARRDSGRR